MDNPLRRGDRLGILCGVEYAAQAVALHGALAACRADQLRLRQPPQGYLASLRGLACRGDRLDLLPGTLIVVAERLFADATRAIYHFTLTHEDSVLLDGRAAIVLKRPE